MTIVLTKVDTEIVWDSTSIGTRTVVLPGSDSSNNGYSLDLKTLGSGERFNVYPESGKIGGLSGITFVDNNCNLFLRSDAENNDWIIRCLCCYTPVSISEGPPPPPSMSIPTAIGENPIGAEAI